MMPFGLCDGPSFMRLMTEVVHGLQNTFIYLDDIIVNSTSADKHIAHLRSLFERLAQHGLKSAAWK